MSSLLLLDVYAFTKRHGCGANLLLQVYLESKTHIKLGSAYVSVGRAVASYTRGPLFKCSSQLSVEKAKQVKLLLILA